MSWHLKESEGRVFRNRWGWALMNKRHFYWLIQAWFDTGYERALDDIAYGRPTSREGRERTYGRMS